MKITSSVIHAANEKIIRPFNVEGVNSAKTDNTPGAQRNIKPADIKKAEFSDFLLDAEKDLIRDLFPSIETKKRANQEFRVPGGKVYGQYSLVKSLPGSAKTKGTIIDIKA